MRHFAVSAVGRDRPGIVAAVSRVLFDHQANIEDSQMTILRGHFTMMLIVATADEVDPARLRSDLEGVRDGLGLEMLSLSDVSELPAGAAAPTHIVSVYGADHPGIVHSVAEALAEKGVNITDLHTRLVADSEAEPLYAMMLEVEVGEGLDSNELDERLHAVAERESVEVAIRPLEQDVL